MSQRRRSRYTVWALGRDEPLYILAPDEDSVRYHYAKRGLIVHTVVKGDLRRETRRQKALNEGGFTIDQKALKTAKDDILGLKLPVRIRLHGRYGTTHGRHRFDGKIHEIMIKRYLTPEEATQTIWHELTHAMQAERVGGGEDFTRWVRYSHRQRQIPYSRRPIEREANQMAAKMAPIHPLTKEQR